VVVQNVPVKSESLQGKQNWLTLTEISSNGLEYVLVNSRKILSTLWSALESKGVDKEGSGLSPVGWPLAGAKREQCWMASVTACRMAPHPSKLMILQGRKLAVYKRMNACWS
jgi:hypothetical protein